MNAPRIVLTAAQLIDPEGGTIADCGVVVEGETILWVGTRADLPAEFDGLQHRDLGDVTLLPGLIDAHVHLSLGTEPTHSEGSSTMASDDGELATMFASARELVEAGVTTARDLGGRGYLALRARDAVDAGE